MRIAVGLLFRIIILTILALVVFLAVPLIGSYLFVLKGEKLQKCLPQDSEIVYRKSIGLVLFSFFLLSFIFGSLLNYLNIINKASLTYGEWVNVVGVGSLVLFLLVLDWRERRKKDGGIFEAVLFIGEFYIRPIMSVTLHMLSGVLELGLSRGRFRPLSLSLAGAASVAVVWFEITLIYKAFGSIGSFYFAESSSELYVNLAMPYVRGASLVVAAAFGVAALSTLWRLKSVVLSNSSLLPISHVRLQREGENLKLRIAHLSDLHTSRDGNLCEGVIICPGATAEILKIARSKRCSADVIVISGDVTDTGSEKEWEIFNGAFQGQGLHRKNVVIAPGNHDLNIVGHGPVSLFIVGDNGNGDGKWKRMERFLVAAIECMPTVKSCRGFGLALELKALKGLPREKLVRSYLFFPLLCKFPGIDWTFVIWNSVRPNGIAFTNSFGKVDEGQIERFGKAVLERNKIIHVMHHKIGLPAAGLRWPVTRWRSRIYYFVMRDYLTASMTLMNADTVRAALTSSFRTVLFHGHHHSEFIGITHDNKIDVVSARSSTIGTESYASQSDVSPTLPFKRSGFLAYTVVNRGGAMIEGSPTVHVGKKMSKAV